MILTCPQCKTKFSVPTTALGEEGRKVRCTLCEHTWFQTPNGVKPQDEPDDVLVDQAFENLVDQDQDADSFSNDDQDLISDNQDFDQSFVGGDGEDLPQVLKSSGLDDEGQDDNQAKPPIALSKAHQLGAAVSLIVLILVMALLFIFKSPLISTWPALNGFYGLFGAEITPKGRNIVFNNLSAEIFNGQITLGGDLVNLSSSESIVLPMLAQQLDDHQNLVKQWVIMPPVDHLPAGGVTAFESIYEAAEDAHSLNVGFTLEDMVAVSTHDEHKDHSGHGDVEGSHGDEAEHGKETHGHEDAHEAEKSHHSDDHNDTPKAKQEHSPAQTDHHNSHGH